METPIRRDSRRKEGRRRRREPFSPLSALFCHIPFYSKKYERKRRTGPAVDAAQGYGDSWVLATSHGPWSRARACRPTSQESNIFKHGKIATAKVAKVDALQRKERCGERLHIKTATFYLRMKETEKDAEDGGISPIAAAASEPHGIQRRLRYRGNSVSGCGAVSRPNYSGGVCRNIRRTREGR